VTLKRAGITDQEMKAVQWQCRNDLRYLCQTFLGYKDWSANRDLHFAIRKHVLKPNKFKIFLIPRDHLKSSIITKGGAIQKLLINPNIRILIANNTWDNARKFLKSIQAHLAPGSLLEVFFGSFQTPRQPWNSDEITIRQRTMILDAPTIATTGLEKEQTSQHYDFIIADDLVARENVQTAEQRQKVKDYINSLMALLEPEGELWIVGTRWSMDDAYGDLLEEGIWDPLVRSAYTDDSRTTPIFSEKFSLEKLQFLRNKLGATLFSCWYLNDPISQEAADFKKEWIKYYVAGTPHPSRLYLTIDPALSLSRDADYSALVVAGMFSDRRIRVVDYERVRVVPSGLVEVVFKLVKKWGLHSVGIETFAFQKTLKYEIQRKQREAGIFFGVDELGRRNSGGRAEPFLSKEARIRRLQPYFEQGLIEIRSDMHDLVDELLSFPRGKRDDLIDALSYQLDHLVPSQGAPSSLLQGERLNGETGKYEMTMDYWTKNHMQKPTPKIYERFFADLK
jgi:predicted phage terminase large subunit-like protein